MSDSARSSLNLEQQRKRAKELPRAHADGSADAAVRVVAHLPRARLLSPRDVLAPPLTSERRARALDAVYCLAVRYDHRAAGEWLRMRGATESALTPADRAIGAALAGEPNPAPAADLRGSLEEEHHRMLAWAIRHGREAAVPKLLRLGPARTPWGRGIPPAPGWKVIDPRPDSSRRSAHRCSEFHVARSRWLFGPRSDGRPPRRRLRRALGGASPPC